MKIRISGAKEHNLRDIDVEFGEGLTAVTGVSGSGKTSLVFDTLYHEARRRFLEVHALGSVAERLVPANVDAITGLGPAVAIGQNLLNRNPNSTVASATGLSPFLRILYARYGDRACPNCATALLFYSEDEAVDRLRYLVQGGPCSIYASLVRSAPGSHATLLQLLGQEFGQGALRVNGREFVDGSSLDPAQGHDIAVKVASLTNDHSLAKEAREAVHNVLALGAVVLTAHTNSSCEILSLAPVCTACGHWFSELDPTHFHRLCPYCEGVGCERCAHTGMLPEAAAVRWQGLTLPDLLSQSVVEAQKLFSAAVFPGSAQRLQMEIDRRLAALLQVGLGYLSLDRPSPSLSRGEAQRARLAVTFTSRLEDMLHVFDEPTIGQHAADTERFLPILRDLPGPVVYVEHDRAATAAADQAIDLGPGAGEEGGHVLFSGPPSDLWQADTPSGRFFSGRQQIPCPNVRPQVQEFLEVGGAFRHNLRDVNARFPLGRLTVVSGVSGSGKSTLVEDVLAASLSAGEPTGCLAFTGPLLKPVLVDQSPIGRNPRSNPATYTQLSAFIRDLFANATGLSPSHFSFNRPEGACSSCSGMGAIEIKMRFLPSSWIPCAACGGSRFSDEVLTASVDFDGRSLSIADIYQLSVSEAASLLPASPWLASPKQRSAQRILQALLFVGLDYLRLGQPSPSLSGGEAQRVKLAKFLGRRSLDQNLLILDEPTTGLHPQDVSQLLRFLDRLVSAGGSVVAVEHNLDFIKAADWVIDLGPGAGPNGGCVLYGGPATELIHVAGSPTADALQNYQEPISALPPCASSTPRRSQQIAIENATVHNLQSVNVTFPKNRLTIVTGVSGSGKSSLVQDVLETEARRRFLETLSLYERQGLREGTAALVGKVTGLGVAISVGGDKRSIRDQRATVGSATEVARHLAALLAWTGERRCLNCGQLMILERSRYFGGWRCPACGEHAFAEARHFSPTTYAAACQTCNGVGTLQIPNPEKLIIHPEKPLCGGAMYSPGFFPKGYLCKPFNHGYDMVCALGERYGFDPANTPWNKMPAAAQNAFLFGDEEPMQVTLRSRTRTSCREIVYPGFYGFIRDWDVGGTYTDTRPCPSCEGAKLRREYLAVTLGGYNVHQLSSMALGKLAGVVAALPEQRERMVPQQMLQASLDKINRRLRFLIRVGLDYLHLDRLASTLAAGEAQRIKIAGLLGSGLTSLTVLLDEPTRGLHPSEVDALIGALHELRDEGNTVIVVEHDLGLIRAADHLVDIGPGAGSAGGRIVAQGNPQAVAQGDTATGRWLRHATLAQPLLSPRRASGWLLIRGARANNLHGEDVRLPLGMLTGICGVSGSGKSTLLIDTLGRFLAPRKQTTSVAYEPIEPGAYDSIEGAPGRTILVDQAKAGVTSPLAFLGLERPLRILYAATGDAIALDLAEDAFRRNCSACKGRGLQRLDMGFLPPVHTSCEICQGTGFLPEAWQVRWGNICLPDLVSLTVDQAYELLQDQTTLVRPLIAVREVGLGYLVLRQPGFSLSGGEVQRLKIAKELSRRTRAQTLYILDEPTVGLHMADVQRLTGVLNKLVEQGHSVVVIEHHVSLLAACDWIIELGPGGGPRGGRIIAAGTPQRVAAGDTPSASYLQEALAREKEGRGL
jgi:excinuclease ABC subunit A